MRYLSFRSFALVLIFCCILLIARVGPDSSHSYYGHKFSTQPVRRALLRKVLEQDNTFVSANHPRLHYVGRWASTSNRLRRDASFPGAYLEFATSNASSVYLQLRNTDAAVLQKAEEHDNTGSRQLVLLPGDSQTPPQKPVSLLIEVSERTSHHFQNDAYGIVAILENQSGPTEASMRVTLLQSAASTMEIEGLWLSNGARLQSLRNPSATGIGSRTQLTRVGRLVEVVRPSSTSYRASYEGSYPSLLAASLSRPYHHHLSISHCLTTICDSQQTMNHVYFRSGLPSTPHYSLPYYFPPPHPSVLILELGVLDYQYLLSTSPSTHATTQFNHKFVEAYVSFVKTVRAYAYPHHSKASSTGVGLVDQAPGLGLSLDYGASFSYNSAPSTLPIFLITPFTPDKKLRRLLSHVIAETVNKLQRDGDKSTFWLDTSNWLERDDFDPYLAEEEADRTHVVELTAAAHKKVAAYLSLHLCPYIAEAEREDCPFHKFDNYLGHLYVPEEAGMGKWMEERKIELVRNALGLDWG